MTPRHILLVDDEDALRDLTRLTLETFGGHRVSAYASGAQAVRCAGGQVFDLLLIDVMMPGMGGFGTLEALRQLPGLAHVPAVFLTGRTQAQELEAYRPYNIADVIAKPFDPALLCDRLDRIWAGSQSAAAEASVAPEALVIEDDLSILYLVQFILEEQGYRVRSATDGKAGRQAIQAGPAQVAVLVLDITLPDEDGLQLLTRVRTDPRWNRVPVLVLSALRDEATMGQAFAAGADDYLNKPFDPHLLAARIKRLAKGPRGGLAQAATTS